MSTARTLTIALMALATLVAASASWAQGTLVAKPDSSGLIHISRGGVELATIELNAHGPGWVHAPQSSATAQVTASEQSDLRFTGALPIPNTEGGALNYTEDITELPQGLRIEYEVTVAAAMLLNGLQVSVNLPVDVYAGKELMVSSPHAEAKIIGLPEEQPEAGRSQLSWNDGSRVEVAAGTEDAIAVELRAATDVVILDLREWEHPLFEVRFPAIMQDPGREMTLDDRFHLDLMVTFAAPVDLQTP